MFYFISRQDIEIQIRHLNQGKAFGHGVSRTGVGLGPGPTIHGIGTGEPRALGQTSPTMLGCKSGHPTFSNAQASGDALSHCTIHDI